MINKTQNYGVGLIDLAGLFTLTQEKVSQNKQQDIAKNGDGATYFSA